MYSLGLFLAKRSYHIIKEKRFYDTGNPAGRPTQMFLKTDFNKFMIIQHSQARFLVGFQKHFKATTNILRHAKYIGKIKMPDAWLQILKNDRIGAFRLTYFYEYKFPENLANVEMNLDDFVVPQRGQNIYGYNLQHFETFITKLNKYIALFGAIVYFAEKEEKNGINFINPKNKASFL